MLLMMHALANSRVDRSRTRAKSHHPNDVISGLVAISEAIAPTGAWTVFVAPLKTEEVPTARARASHLKSSKRACGHYAKSFMMLVPTKADKK